MKLLRYRNLHKAVLLGVPALFALCSCSSQPDTTAVSNIAARPPIVGTLGGASGGYAGAQPEPGLTEQQFGQMLTTLPPGLLPGYLSRHPEESRYVLSQSSKDPVQQELTAILRTEQANASHIQMTPKKSSNANSDN